MDNPLNIFKCWLAEAKKNEINDYNAMSISTVKDDGYPDCRIVLLKQVCNEGFTFFTNKFSNKGIQITHSNKVALTFHWKSMLKQVRVIGNAYDTDATTSDDYFHSRSIKSQIAACASNQSQILKSRQELIDRFNSISEKIYDEDNLEKIVTRPPEWGGYIIKPLRIEFWEDGDHRLHSRKVFTRNDDKLDITASKWNDFLLNP